MAIADMRKSPLQTGYKRLERSTRHQHVANGLTVTHDHSSGATKHWHKRGSWGIEFGPEPKAPPSPRKPAWPT